MEKSELDKHIEDNAFSYASDYSEGWESGARNTAEWLAARIVEEANLHSFVADEGTKDARWAVCREQLKRIINELTGKREPLKAKTEKEMEIGE